MFFKQNLIKSLENGNLKRAEELIREGKQIHIKDRNNRTPLFLATEKGYLDIVKLLIEKGAKVLHKDKFGNDVLKIAKEKGYSEILEIIKIRINKINESKKENEKIRNEQEKLSKIKSKFQSDIWMSMINGLGYDEAFQKEIQRFRIEEDKYTYESLLKLKENLNFKQEIENAVNKTGKIFKR